MIALLLALAVGLFTVSLPIAKTGLGARLRQAAGVCFILALLPSLVGGLFYAGSAPTTPVRVATPHDLFSQLGCVALVVIAAFIAYGVLKLRSFFAAKAKPRDPWESFLKRGGGKRPFTKRGPDRMRSRDPFSFDGDEDDAV